MHKTTDTVIIEGMQFKPKQLTVYKGDTIIWINNDIVAHNVTEDTAQTWTSDSIDIGKTWTMIPSKSFNYLCSIHPTMKGVVTVIER
ncbi:MAG: plastocyanin [Bacteroidetes bacterium]|nr:plastocyanin [Bacteroidota bacterium]